MSSDVFRDLPALDDHLQALAESSRGRMARVVSADGHMVTVEVPRKGGWDGPLGPYPATSTGLEAEQLGVLIPLKGSRALFVAVGQAPLSVTLAPWLAGRWMNPYMQWGVQEAIGTKAVVANRTYGVAFACPQDATVSELGFYVGTAITGSSAKLGIFATNPSTGYATGSPIVETASISTATAGTKSAAITPTDLKPGALYVLAMVASHAISVAMFTAARGFYPTTGYSHNNYVSAVTDGGSFAWATPTASVTVDNIAIGARRQP